MENNQGEHQKGSDTKVCNSWMCGGAKACGCMGGFDGHGHLLRSLIKLIIVVFIFCFAFKMGELKGMLESRGNDFGYRTQRGGMMYNNDNSGYYGGGMGMDDGSGMNAQTTPAVPATPAQ